MESLLQHQMFGNNLVVIMKCCEVCILYRSYGVLLWEIASFAVEIPYSEEETSDVIEAISSGRVMLERYAYPLVASIKW